jgi:actin related protein 2/3 complex subunit 4
MATSHRDYHDAVRAALESAFALRSAPSKKMSGENRAEVEYADAPSLLMPSAEITRGCAEDGACLIERAVNSARVSVRVRQCDELEEILARALCKSLGRRADAFEVLRRAPVEGYDVSFLVLLAHAERMEAKGLVDFVVTFMEDVDKEISEQKLSVSSRGRTVAAAYLKQFA